MEMIVKLSMTRWISPKIKSPFWNKVILIS